MSASPHRPLALVAAGMLAFAAILVGLRDSFLVPLLTGQLGYWMVVDHFWTPAVNWLAVGSMGGGIVCGALAALTWRQARVGGKGLPRLALVGFFGGLALVGAVVGVLAALGS